jgi:hypothetical protein
MKAMELEVWLRKATRSLAAESAAQVTREIGEHYDAARETAIRNGATAEQAHDAAIGSLGSPRIANRQYRRVLLTANEAGFLRMAQKESSAACERSWIVKSLRLAALAGLLGSGIAVAWGNGELARMLFGMGLGLTAFLMPALLTIRTLRGSRIVRTAKWTALLALTWILFGPEPSKWLGGTLVCFGSMVWVEWTYYRIRQKLPMASWPKALFY